MSEAIFANHVRVLKITYVLDKVLRQLFLNSICGGEGGGGLISPGAYYRGIKKTSQKSYIAPLNADQITF